MRTNCTSAEKFSIVFRQSDSLVDLTIGSRSLRKRRVLGDWVWFIVPRIFGSFDPGQRVQWKTESDGRITRNKIQRFGAQEPCTRKPPAPVGRALTLDREDMTHHLVEALFENSRKSGPLQFVAKI